MGRIETIVSQIENMDTVADIGCDHGLISKLLLEENRAKRVIAVDISAPSLQKAADMARQNALAVGTRQGDGLEPLEVGEAQAAVIAGMGGLLIRDILRARPEVAGRMSLLVLSPNRNELELRLFLRQNGYAVVREKLAKERGRLYQVICAAPAKGERDSSNRWEDEYGSPALRRSDPLWQEFLEAKSEEVRATILKVKEGTGTLSRVREMEEKWRWLEAQKEEDDVHNG